MKCTFGSRIISQTFRVRRSLCHYYIKNPRQSHTVRVEHSSKQQAAKCLQFQAATCWGARAGDIHLLATGYTRQLGTYLVCTKSAQTTEVLSYLTYLTSTYSCIASAPMCITSPISLRNHTYHLYISSVRDK